MHWDCLLQYEVGLSIVYWRFYMERHVIGQCYCYWLIPVDILSHFNKFLKGAYTLFLLFYFFATLIFYGKLAKVKVLFRKTSGMRNCYLKNGLAKVLFWFGVSSKQIRWNIYDQFRTLKLKFAGSKSFVCH